MAIIRGRVAGLATGELLSPDRAEVAFLVADEDRGRGLGSLLLEHLAALGRRHGVSRFEAEVLGDNYGMLRVFRAAGFEVARRTVAGEVEVELRTDVSREAVDAADRREWRAAARSLRPLLHPTSVAVVGVRRSAGGFGHGVLDAIRSSSYAGTLHVIHPEADSIDGLPTSRSLEVLDGPVDLVVVAVPADGVADVMRDAVANRAGAAVVISSGFSGTGSEERRLELLALARAHSLRLVGPNSQGVLVNGAGLNATLLHDVPEVGGLAVASQSGGMGFALLDLARDVGVGVQSFVSLGDKVDVSSNDLLAAWMDDDDGRGRRALPRVVRQRAQVRPHRSPLRRAEAAAGRGRGRSRARQDPAAVSTVGVGVDALLDQSGVIACRTGAELAETALLLVEQPLPAGLRVCIVSNTGGVGALTTDRAEQQGMLVTTMPDELGATLRAAVPGRGRRSQPGRPRGRRHARGAHGRAACRARRRRGRRRPGPARRQPAHRPRRAVRGRRAGAPLGRRRPTAPRHTRSGVRRGPWPAGGDRLPHDRCSDRVVGSCHAVRRVATRPGRPARGRARHPRRPRPHLGAVAAGRPQRRAGVAGALRPGRAAGAVRHPPRRRLATGPDEAQAAAAEIGYPVAVKVADPTVQHKSDRGLVRIDVRTGADVAGAVRRFADELGRDHVDVLVQPLVLGHVASVGLVRDPQLGPLVRVGSGAAGPAGSWAEDVLLLPPVEAADAARAVRALKIWPQLVGDHGLEEVDLAPLEALVMSVGRLAVDVPHVAHLTLEPVVLNAHGIFCVDVKVRIAVPTELDDGVPRRLRS